MGITRREMMALGAASAIAGPAAAQQQGQGMQIASNLVTLKTAYDGKEYVKPKLPYAYDALEPHYGQDNLRIHYEKHHTGYVNGLNTTLRKLAQARDDGDFPLIQKLSRDLAFHGSGHILHCLFWYSMVPGGTQMPSNLRQAVERDFGSAEKCSEQFKAATKAVEASGWGILAFEPVAEKLLILQAEKHQDLTVWGVVPLLVCDVWEHAYYLKYANNRGEWVNHFMEIANWQYAGERLAMAKATGRGGQA